MWEYYDIARVLNAVLALVVLVLATMKARHLWHFFPFAARLMYLSFGGLLISICYGSCEALVIDAEPGFRVSFMTGALLVSLGGFLYPDEEAEWMMRLVPLRDRLKIGTEVDKSL